MDNSFIYEKIRLKENIMKEESMQLSNFFQQLFGQYHMHGNKNEKNCICNAYMFVNDVCWM